MSITKVPILTAGKELKIKLADVCYERAYLSAISDTMFLQGNPKYIWVDLMRDGYVHDGEMTRNNIFIFEKGVDGGGNIDIPQQTREAYAKKWQQFVLTLNEPPDKYGKYLLSTWYPVSASDIVNPKSAFRQISKSELHNLRLTSRGELRFISELVKDGLASTDKALNLDFSKDGFYIYGERLTREQREKYMTICQEEFGSNYYNDGSSFKRRPLSENILSKEIDELTARINAVKPPSDK